MPPSSSRDGKLTLNVKNITVKELLQTIEKQSRYTFVYNISDLDPARRVSLSVTDASVEAVIAQAIPEVTATVRGTQVVLVRKAADKARPNVKITGTVRDADGVPLVGATLIVEGTTLGMSTGANGEYTLNVPANGKIVCSYLGYDSVTETVNARTRIDFQLRAAANSIEDVVVTALGITRKEKSLGYAVSKIGSDDITNNASGSWLSGMAGKVAGLNLDQSAAGPGGSVRVTLRGEGSLSYNNNTALFVVDGVPIGSGMDSNTSSGSYESDDAPIDYGNGAGDINPDDVESISVLKGPAATALYGSRAANGAIIVTTKSGRKQKGIGVTFTTSVTFDKAGYWPDFQNVYGAGDFRKTTINTGHMTNGLNPDEYSFYTVDADHSDTGKKVNAFHSRYQFGEKIQGQMRYMYASFDPATGNLYAASVRSMRLVQGILPDGRYLHQQSGGGRQRRPWLVAARVGQGYAQRLDRAQYGFQHPELHAFGYQQAEQIHRGRIETELLPQKFGQPARGGIQQFVAPENVALATCERFGPRCIQRMEQRPAGRLLFGQRFFGEAD